MMPPHCTSTALDDDGIPRSCVLEIGHEGDHLGWDTSTWEDPGKVLARLTSRWGRTHRFACTGRNWFARHRAPDSHWQVESAPTPDLLEERLQSHHGDPSGPPANPPKEGASRAHV